MSSPLSLLQDFVTGRNTAAVYPFLLWEVGSYQYQVIKKFVVIYCSGRSGVINTRL